MAANAWPSALAAARWPEAPAVSDGRLTLTWDELERLVAAQVYRLRSGGLAKGTAVGLFGLNSLDWIVAALAIPRAGGVLLPLNTRLALPEIAWQIETACAGLVLVAGCSRGAWHELGAARAICAESRVMCLSDLACGFRQAAGKPVEDRLGGAHTILFTSGTTGRPKGAVLTWSNHVASAQACIVRLGLDQHDRYLACIPFFHVGGLNILYRLALVGGCVVIQERFEPRAVLEAMRHQGVTRTSLTATMLRRVLDVAGPAGIPAAVRTILVGGEHAAPALLARSPQALATYGLTETCSHVTVAEAGDCETAGRPLPGYEVRIADDDGRILPNGSTGRIEVRGPAVMAKYLSDEPLGQTCLAGLAGFADEPGGRSAKDWLNTGDLGHLDDQGRLVVQARRQDLIVSGGENVYPAEIEAALGLHPAVVECAVVGIADDRWGEAPAAIVALGQSFDVPDRELELFLRQVLGGYKIPRAWVIVPELPRLPSGKVDRQAVRVLARTRPLR